MADFPRWWLDVPLSTPNAPDPRAARLARRLLNDPAMPNNIDTENRFLVAALGQDVTILAPPRANQRLTNADAMNLAAWLAVLADPTGDNFRAVLAAIKET